jgi:hypothetical protein
MGYILRRNCHLKKNYGKKGGRRDRSEGEKEAEEDVSSYDSALVIERKITRFCCMENSLLKNILTCRKPD